MVLEAIFHSSYLLGNSQGTLDSLLTAQTQQIAPTLMSVAVVSPYGAQRRVSGHGIRSRIPPRPAAAELKCSNGVALLQISRWRLYVQRAEHTSAPDERHRRVQCLKDTPEKWDHHNGPGSDNLPIRRFCFSFHLPSTSSLGSRCCMFIVEALWQD
jgi:hypothetical protein